MHSLGASLPVIFPGQTEQKAAYRLLSNDGVTMEPILDSHTEQTVERCGTEPLVLAIQDTTTLNDAPGHFMMPEGTPQRTSMPIIQ